LDRPTSTKEEVFDGHVNIEVLDAECAKPITHVVKPIYNEGEWNRIPNDLRIQADPQVI
jgi:hypothetical protein